MLCHRRARAAGRQAGFDHRASATLRHDQMPIVPFVPRGVGWAGAGDRGLSVDTEYLSAVQYQSTHYCPDPPQSAHREAAVGSRHEDV